MNSIFEHPSVLSVSKKIPVSAVVLTFNEEKNITDCLKSLVSWTQEIFVVDSFSTDNTVAIVESFGIPVFTNPFENYASQRNWALKNLPFTTDWIINIDADNRITPKLSQELTYIFEKSISDDIKGFLASRQTIFMDKWIRFGGHYPTYHAFMFRKGFGTCENKLYDQHFVINGKTQILKGDIIDILTDSISSFTERHNRWASLEADEQMKTYLSQDNLIKGNIAGNPIEKRRAMRNFYNWMPLFIRPYLYFFVRYFVKLGFLDGKAGMIFHFLQGFWFRFLVDAKIYEARKRLEKNND
ncbi:MAG: glycosyltransferase family 2 protein [Verrucomicrobia bacterium]|nr:glycosyltransferase family 2 protein [Cytophagales bacterium]